MAIALWGRWALRIIKTKWGRIYKKKFFSLVVSQVLKLAHFLMKTISKKKNLKFDPNLRSLKILFEFKDLAKKGYDDPKNKVCN